MKMQLNLIKTDINGVKTVINENHEITSTEEVLDKNGVKTIIIHTKKES